MQTCPKCILQQPHTVYGGAVLGHCGCADVPGMSDCWRMLCGSAQFVRKVSRPESTYAAGVKDVCRCSAVHLCYAVLLVQPVAGAFFLKGVCLDARTLDLSVCLLLVHACLDVLCLDFRILAGLICDVV